MNAVLTVLISYLLHVAFTAGLVSLFGVVIAGCNKLFYSSLGDKSTVICCVTGFIGTPIHELSHALMCLVFGHKITEIKLFQMNSDDGVLGYVNHTYNPKNVYQKTGNFFIGIAPVFVGFLLLSLLFYAFLPSAFASCVDGISSVSVSDGIGGLFSALADLFGVLIDCLDTWQWWVFLFVGSFIALHMTLSKADWQGALSGIGFYLAIFAVVDVVVAIVSMDLLHAMTAGIFSFAVFVLYFGVIFVVCILAITLLWRVLVKTLLKRFI